MKRKRTFIPTSLALLTVCAVGQIAAATALQAQTPARQAFPWSSARATQAAPASSFSGRQLTRSHSQPQAVPSGAWRGNARTTGQSFSSGSAVTENVVVEGETIYLDEQGNEITRAQLQAKLTSLQSLPNEVGASIPTVERMAESFGQDVQQAASAPRPVDKTIWGKAKDLATGVTSVLKTPAVPGLPSLKSGFFKTPEGLHLPTRITRWGAPKIDQPTTWFSRELENPITFAPAGGLPRAGQVPTSIAADISGSQYVARATPANLMRGASVKMQQQAGDVVGQSIFQEAQYEVAESVGDNSFMPRR